MRSESGATPWLLLLLFCGACTSALHPRGGDPASTPAPAVHLGGPVEVRAGAPDVPGRLVHVMPYDVRIDYAEFTAAAVKRLNRAIEEQSHDAGPPRSLEIVVMYVDILRAAGSFSCLIDYRVVLGDGQVRGVQARDASWNHKTACGAAIGDVVGATLRDPVIARYLSQSEPD